ncbi:hypothetical protein RN49_19670 [Pantoea agglomerans]|nr:hypothetical protein RN49_19670 [Pantoea agglomerans]
MGDTRWTMPVLKPGLQFQPGKGTESLIELTIKRMTRNRMISSIVIIRNAPDHIYIALVTRILTAHIRPGQANVYLVLRTGGKQTPIAKRSRIDRMHIVSALIGQAHAEGGT